MRKLSIQNQQGFSLVEALIAMVILSIGLLAVALMQVGAMKGNTNALSRSNGLSMAQSVMDTLRTLPFDSSLLTDNGSALDDGRDAGAGFDDTVADQTNGEVTGSNGQNYTIFWNIVDNDLNGDAIIDEKDLKTIRLFVYWNDQKFGLNRVIVTSVFGGLYL
jgi:type IV pilus modification protein PilV